MYRVYLKTPDYIVNAPTAKDAEDAMTRIISAELAECLGSGDQYEIIQSEETNATRPEYTVIDGEPVHEDDIE
jgi:hypothetical protein